MSESTRHIPNYPAFVLLLAVVVPLIFIELNPEILSSGTWADFYYYYKKYFKFIVLFQVILFAFVFSKVIIQYDNIPPIHRSVALMISLVLGFGLAMQIIAWLGYFTGGFYIFEWLNK